MAQNEGSTVIGETILVHGNVQGDEDLTVRGRVEGTITVAKALVVEPGGVVQAEVQARTCVVSGSLVGNVTASESVEIARDGRMVGDITAPRVVIVDGATFQGRIDMGEAVEEEGERPALARAPAPRPALRAPPARAAAAVRAAPAADRGEDEDSGERGGGAKPPAPPVPVAMGAVKRKVIVRRK